MSYLEPLQPAAARANSVSVVWRRVILSYVTEENRLACRVSSYLSNLHLPQRGDPGFLAFVGDLFANSRVFDNVPDAIRAAEDLRYRDSRPFEGGYHLLYGGYLTFA